MDERVRDLTDRQVLNLMDKRSRLNEVRRLVSQHAAHMEQAEAQVRPLGSIDIRRHEFSVALQIAAILGVPAGEIDITGTLR